MNKAEITQSVADLLLPAIISVIKARCEAQAEITWHARDGEIEEAEKRGAEKVVEEIARLALISDDTTLKSYVVGLLEQVKSKFGNLKDSGIGVKE